MKYWGRSKNPSWAEIVEKPFFLSDNIIKFSEIQEIPDKISFLADPLNNPPEWNPWVLSSFYGYYLEWMPLKSDSTPWTMVQRNGAGDIIANNFRAVNVPIFNNNLSRGTLYKDVNNFIKVVP